MKTQEAIAPVEALYGEILTLRFHYTSRKGLALALRDAMRTFEETPPDTKPLGHTGMTVSRDAYGVPSEVCGWSNAGWTELK